MVLYMGALQVQLISAYLYFLYTKRNPALLNTLNGKVLTAGLLASSYLFFRTEFVYGTQDAARDQQAIKIGSHFVANSFWGASICSFLINFLPQVNLGLVLPLCFSAAFFDSSIVMKTYRPGVEGTGSVIAWFYSNETTFLAASLCGLVGMMAGLGLVMLTPSYKWIKGDALQVLSVAGTVVSINALASMISMGVLDKDFKYGPYNKWDASMTYIWRVIPLIYLPVDYFFINRHVKERGARQLYKHPEYSWIDFDYENDYHEEEELDASKDVVPSQKK